MTTTVLQAPSVAAFANSTVQTAYGNATVGATGLVTVDSRAVAALMGAGFTVASVRTITGAHTTTSGEAAANAVALATGLTAITGQIIQVLDAGNNVVTSDADITSSGGTLTVADGATYNTVAGQIIHWIAFGY